MKNFLICESFRLIYWQENHDPQYWTMQDAWTHLQELCTTWGFLLLNTKILKREVLVLNSGIIRICSKPVAPSLNSLPEAWLIFPLFLLLRFNPAWTQILQIRRWDETRPLVSKILYKAPEPDGFQPSFKKCWHSVATCLATWLRILYTLPAPSPPRWIHICLIPNCKEPKTVGQSGHRALQYCIKSGHQISGRLLRPHLDARPYSFPSKQLYPNLKSFGYNFILCKKFYIQGTAGYMVVKIDLEKANRLEWSFVKNTLLHFNFLRVGLKCAA